MSRQIQDLEEELGTKLFVRSNHRIILTPDGLLLRRRAQEIVDLILFIASEKGQFINGENIMIDGGRNAMGRWN